MIKGVLTRDLYFLKNEQVQRLREIRPATHEPKSLFYDHLLRRSFDPVRTTISTITSQQVLDMFMDQVADLADRVQRLSFRIRQRPVNHAQFRDKGASLAATHGYKQVRFAGNVFRQALRLCR